MADFKTLFPTPKPVIGMIHLAGRNGEERLERALWEIELLDKEGVDGALIEDYHGTYTDVWRVLRATANWRTGLVKGVNILHDPYTAFDLADEFGAGFVQFDSIQTPDLELELFRQKREGFPEIVVLGGVGFKYKKPTGNPLEQDLREGMRRCEAIVTTGPRTGIETPIEKLREYKRILDSCGGFYLLVGAGVTADNITEQTRYADGVIVGSHLKNGDTQRRIIRDNVRRTMDKVRALR